MILQKQHCNTKASLEPFRRPQPEQELAHNLRAQPNRIFNDSSRLKISSMSFCLDAARLWNQAPATLTSATTILAQNQTNS